MHLHVAGGKIQQKQIQDKTHKKLLIEDTKEKNAKREWEIGVD